jgi:hypothetical protein
MWPPGAARAALGATGAGDGWEGSMTYGPQTCLRAQARPGASGGGLAPGQDDTRAAHLDFTSLSDRASLTYSTG